MTGVKYVSMDGIGYGVAAKRQIQALVAAGVPVTWEPMVRGNGWGLGFEPFRGARTGDRDLDPLLRLGIAYDVVVLHVVPEYFPRLREREPGCRRFVGLSVWETDRLPAHWPALFELVHGVVVPCRWNLEVFRQSGVRCPIHVVPHPSDPQPLPKPARLFRVGARDFVFYTIGEWNVRKGIDETVRAYCSAFTGDDPVVLVIKTDRRCLSRLVPLRWWRRQMGSRRALRRILREFPRPPRVRLITRELDDSAIRSLHARGDCYVSLCRAEGWGLGAFDAATRGRPLIITGHGGQLDYASPPAARLVDYRLVPVHEPTNSRSYTPDQSWAEPSLSSARDHMRAVFAHPEAARSAAAGRAREMAACYDPAAIAPVLAAALSGEADARG